MSTTATAGLDPEVAIALIGVLGVGSQWLAWRLRIPGIVMMLAAGLLVGPVLGIMVPARDLGRLVGPMISIAVAIILFEGGLTLRLQALRDAAAGVRRLVVIGAPLGWLLSALALHYVAGLGWAASSVFGGAMIVTGPTVIAPLLRQARLSRRPATLLQWEAIVNDPLGALAAVLAFYVIASMQQGHGTGMTLLRLLVMFAVAGAIGGLAGRAVALAFRRELVPEYMKVPVLFVAVLAIFVVTDQIVHEGGLLAVTLMGLVIANSDLPSFVELRRFKEHATVLLVSGVFILLAASMDLGTLSMLDWRAAAFIAVVVLVVRPATVLLSLAGSRLPWNERLLVAFTGPRGVVLGAIAAFFAARLSAMGLEDGARIVPLAFVLVVSTVVLYGFALAPLARRLGLAGTETPGLLIVGGSPFATELGIVCKAHDIPVLVIDRIYSRLRQPREAGLQTYFGDILSEGAEYGVELVSFDILLAATDNDAYNTLVATDLAPEFGRNNVFQLTRQKETGARHALPSTLGGHVIGRGIGFYEMNGLLREGWKIRVTRIGEEFGLTDWRDRNPDAFLIGRIEQTALRLMRDDEVFKPAPGTQLVAMVPPAAA
ncbi:cation:proton antiporter [Tropicimonas sp.]|uniref:cation:proton antiporter n=1 Tax=Tropicimonas sp. TaxID=2067044 RepID=UPI003A8C5A15